MAAGGSNGATAWSSVALVGAEVGRVARDRFDRRTAVPRTIDEVDAAYLSGLLGARVRAVEPLDRTSGTTDRARLRLVADDPGDPDVPASVFVKIAPTKAVTRVFTNLAGLGTHEVGFYRAIRPQLGLEAPAAVGLDLDPRSKRFAIVLKDLEPRGVRFTDTVQGLSVAEAGAVVDTLARLHAPFWGSPELAASAGTGTEWPISNSADPQLPVIARLLRLAGRRLAKRDPALVPPIGRTILDRYLEVAADLDSGAHTILHGDPHPGNVYLVDGPGDDDADVRGGLLDWQVLRRGNGARDLAYLLVLGLEPELRRADGAALIERYRVELAAVGGPALDAEELAFDVRRMVAYTYASAAFTAAFAGLQDAAVTSRGLAKAVAAMADLDTAGALATSTGRRA